MIPWWVTVFAFITGGVFGVFLLALCAAGQSEAERRWRDEQCSDRHK
jgi:hypothetical protein